MAYVLDAGALIAADRRDARVTALLALAKSEQQPIRVPAGVVAQAWRGGSRQAALSRLLETVEEIALDEDRSRKVGEILGASNTSDIADASVIQLTRPGDVVLTSDDDDIEHISHATKARIRIIHV
jgi:hypothetical protein